jgi:hypothetical protein
MSLKDLWTALRIHSRQPGTAVSELVRQAVRERYLGAAGERRKAMEAFAGSRADRPEFADPESYVRKLRRGSRLEGISRP